MSDPRTRNEIARLRAEVELLKEAVTTMAWWLVQAQTGFGKQDAEGIERILAGKLQGQAQPKEQTP